MRRQRSFLFHSQICPPQYEILTLLGAVREFLGTGKIFDLTIMPEEYGMLVFVLAPGAFIALGYLIAIINKLRTEN